MALRNTSASAKLPIRIGCAGWNVPKPAAADFPSAGSHLQRYAARFNTVEINSSFYREHQPATYARWAASVPGAFRFSVKMPRSITHARRLAGCGPLLDAFFSQAGALGAKLGCVLIQLPPSLVFEKGLVSRFLRMLRRRHAGAAVLEPRHASWFDGRADDVLRQHRVGRVAADPAVVAAAAGPGGDPTLVYVRLHGSPQIYYSAYPPAYLDSLAQRLRAAQGDGAQVWCIFDNTARGAATVDALYTGRVLASRPGKADGALETQSWLSAHIGQTP